MTSRQQLDHETLVALVELLDSRGIITSEEAAALLDRRDLEHARDAKRAFKEGRGPPEWASADNGNGGGST
jgi:hypothetical protein